MRTVLALAAVAALASWTDSAEAFGKKNRGCGGYSSCSCYDYSYGGCASYGSYHGCSHYGGGYGCGHYGGGYGCGYHHGCYSHSYGCGYDHGCGWGGCGRKARRCCR